MIDLTIYGTTSSTYGYMKTMIYKIANDAGISIKLHEINDVSAFVNQQIMSIPAYQLNGTIIEKRAKNMNEFLRELQIALLKKAQYGNLKQIHVPIDFSEASDNAITYALNLSKGINAAIRLIHIFRPDPISTENDCLHNEMIDIKKQQLSQLADELNKKWIGQHNTTIVDSELKIGFVNNEIQNISNDNSDDWIVMGSTGSSLALKKIFGSVSTAVAKNSKCPVFIIPSLAKYSPPKKIAYYSTDGKFDHIAIDHIMDLAERYNAEIHIVYIHKENQNHIISNDLKKVKIKYPGIELQTTVLTGNDKVSIINRFCEYNKINLLTLVRQERDIFRELFYKNITKQMTITTKIPLLIIPNNSL